MCTCSVDPEHSADGFTVIIKKQQALGLHFFFQSSHCDPPVGTTRILMRQIRTKSSRVEYSRKYDSVTSVVKVTFQDLLFQ